MSDEVRIKIKIDSNSQELVLMKQQVQELGKSFTDADSFANTFMKRINLAGHIYAGYQVLNQTIGELGARGFGVNKEIQKLNNSLTTSSAVMMANTDVYGNAITVADKYKIAQIDAAKSTEMLQKANINTPHTMNQTVKIYDSMYFGMRKVGASTKDMVEITEKLSIAAGNKVPFDAFLSAMDGISTGTVEANSEMGRFLSSVGLSNEEIKNSSDVVQLFKDKLSEFKAIPDFESKMSNLSNSTDMFAKNLMKIPFDWIESRLPTTAKMFDDWAKSINEVNIYLSNVSNLSTYDELINKQYQLMGQIKEVKNDKFMWDSEQKEKLSSLNGELEIVFKKLSEIRELEKKAENIGTNFDSKPIDDLVEKTLNPYGTKIDEINKKWQNNFQDMQKNGKDTSKIYQAWNKEISDLDQEEADKKEKIKQEQLSKAKEIANEQKRIAKDKAEVEAEFLLVGLNEWDSKFQKLDSDYKADLVKYQDVIGAKEKLDAIYAENVKNLTNQRNIEAQKEDLSFFERKIQLQDDSLSKELELQGVSYSSRVLEIENTTKSLAEKDKLIAKETELFNLTVQSMNYKYDTEFQDTMSDFYDDMLDSQIALNNAVYDFGAGFDGVSNKIGGVSKSLAAMSTLELTNKKEASKLDKKYIEQFNKYAGDIDKTKTLEQQYTKDTAILNEQNIQSQIEGYANIAGAMANSFDEGSKAAEIFTRAQATAAMVAGTTAVLKAAEAPPPIGFASMLGMAATVTSILANAGIAFGGIGGSTTTTTSDAFSSMEANTGTGTVLGDTTATSGSIVQSLELLADYKKPEFDTLQSMNKYLANISNSIGGVSALIVQTGGYAFGEGFESTDTGWQSKLSESQTKNLSAALTGGTSLITDKLTGGLTTKLIGSVEKGIFGKTSVSTKLKDSGMYFADQLLSNAKDEIYGSMYQTIQTTTSKKSWFKKSATTDTKTKLQDMEGFTETERQFSLILDNMYNSVATAADALDTSFNDIEYKLDNFVVSIGMVSMKGLSGQQIQDKLMAIFGKVGDQLSTTVFPLLIPFQQVGEGMYTTMTRVATGMEEAEYYAARLGNSYKDIAYWQLENTQGNVGFEALLQIIQNTEKATNGANTNFIQLINSLDTTAEELYDTYTTLDRLRSTLTYIKLGVDTISFASIKGAGSADALADGVNAYIDGFLDESEQLSLHTNLLQKEFSKLNLALPNGKQDFRNLIEGIDKTSESGQELWGRLIVLSDSFATVADSTKESIDTLTSSLEELNTNQFDTFISSLNDIGSSIKNVNNTALGFIQGLSTSSSASLEEQLISYNKMRDEFNNYFENGVIKSGVNQDSVSNLYSQISSLASNIAGEDDYLKNSLANQFKDDITSFNFAEDILKVSIVEGLGYLEGLSSQQINQLKYVLDDGKITIAELNSINGLSQIQKDNILKFANNSDYFSTENTLTSLEDYAQQQLSLMKDNSEKDTSSLSAASFAYGDYIGLKEQIDISKLLGVSYGTAKPLIEQLQELSISTDKTKTLNNILGWKDTDTSYDLTKANQISALAPYIEGADVSAYLTNIAATSQQNLLSKQALEKFEAEKAKFNAELLGYETELNSRVSQIGSLQADYDHWKRKDEGDGEGKKYKPAKDAARAAINDNNANIAKLQALIPQLYQQKTLNGFINGSGNILDDQLAWFNKREIVTPPAFSDGIRSGELSLGNNNEIVAAIESLKKITTEQAKLIQKMADALEEFNNREIIKTAKGVA